MASTTQRSATPAPQKHTSNGIGNSSLAGAGSNDGTVNRKKQKRRQKQAARLAAEQPSRAGSASNQGYAENGHEPDRGSLYDYPSTKAGPPTNGVDYGPSDLDDQYEPQEGEDLYYSDEEVRYVHEAQTNGTNSKAKKKRKNKPRSELQHEYQSGYPPYPVPSSMTSSLNPPPPPPPPPPLSNSAIRSAHKVSKDRIWNTSTAEERERIKEFWLSLEEKERRSLVKVEKEAVLKKMKEQQKHSCSCTVCGRKRTAIEEELEVLYDAYYDELEQYANHQQISLDDGTPILSTSSLRTHPMARFPPNRAPPPMNAQRPARGRIQEVLEDDEEGDDDYSDEDEDEEYSDEEAEEEPRGPAADFFNFGNSLTVQGGILTVADDLLKNDGKKFIEMMEQLAERRMQREEEAQYAAAGLRHPSMQGHNHGPPLEEDEYEDDDDEDYGSQDDEDYDDDEMETMTEEQRMEEGRRMFQIFAARMFEQRVLTAYREKVARERQEKLLEELADETRLDVQREAKKAKEAQKKKDKKRQQKQAKEEEKAKRESERAAEEAAARAIEEQKLEEQRQKKEEQRKKKEAEKKAQDEERQKKEAEKQKKLQETREQQLEIERKQREQKDKEKKKREEAKKKEREEREAKEQEAKERKEREMAERKEKEARAKAEKDAKERARKEEQVARQTAPATPVPVPPLLRKVTSTVVPLPPGLQTLQTSSNHASPHLQVATPVIPKAPTPVRPRQASVQGSHTSSPNVPTAFSGSSSTSPSSLQPQQQPASAGPSSSKFANLPPSTQQPPLAAAPLSAPPGILPPQYAGISASPAMTGNGFPMHYGSMMPPGVLQRSPFGHEAPMYIHQQPFSGPQYRNFANQGGLGYPPGMNGIRPGPQGRGTPLEISTTQSSPGSGTIGSGTIGPQHGIGHSTMPSHSHSRNTSASYDKTTFDTPSTSTHTQPIARPVPIQRPSSLPRHGENRQPTQADVDDLSSHLGSSALLDDSDETLNPNVNDIRQANIAPGGPRSGRLGFGSSPMFSDPLGSAKIDNFSRGVQSGSGNTWGMSPMPFGTPTMPSHQTWTNAPAPGWPSNNAFGIIGGPNRPNPSRLIANRLLIIQACNQLTANSLTKHSNGFHDVHTVLRQVEQMKSANEGPIQLGELLEICETEGTVQNGGGSFAIQTDPQRGVYVKFESNDNFRGSAPGEIGSPLPGQVFPAYGAPRPFPPSNGITSPAGF